VAGHNRCTRALITVVKSFTEPSLGIFVVPHNHLSKKSQGSKILK